MKSLIAIFMLFFLLSGMAADFVSHPEQEQHFALRRLLRYVNGNFKVADKAAEVEIFCEETIPPGDPQMTLSSGKARIMLNSLDDWRRDAGVCRKLVILLLRAKTGNFKGDLSALPDWFVSGIAEVASEQTSSARLIRNQHSFPLLDILAANGVFGDPASVINIDAKRLSSGEKAFYREYCKLIMLTLKRVRRFSGLTVLIGDSRKFDAEKFNAAAAKALRALDDRMIAPAYRRELWSDLVPPPERLTRRCLAELLVSEVPELDQDGLPTGKMLKVSLENFAQLADRPDFVFLCRRVASQLYVISIGESREVRSILADLRYILENDIQNFAGEPQEKKTPERTAGTQRRKERSGALAKNEEKFNELLKKNGDVDFRKSVRRFYQEKVVSSDKNSKRSGISRMFSSGSVIDPSFVRSRVADIRSALDRRERLRRFLETESLKMKNVPDEIKYRRNWIYQGDSRHGAWLEMVGKELF